MKANKAEDTELQGCRYFYVALRLDSLALISSERLSGLPPTMADFCAEDEILNDRFCHRQRACQNVLRSGDKSVPALIQHG